MLRKSTIDKIFPPWPHLFELLIFYYERLKCTEKAKKFKIEKTDWIDRKLVSFNRFFFWFDFFDRSSAMNLKIKIDQKIKN